MEWICQFQLEQRQMFESNDLDEKATTEDFSAVQRYVCSGCGKKSKEGCSEGIINDRCDK